MTSTRRMKLTLTEDEALALRSVVEVRLLDLNGGHELFDGEKVALQQLSSRLAGFIEK